MQPTRFEAGSAVVHAASKVEISVRCRDLMDMDVFSKSDPMVVLFTRQPGASEWREYDRTETIWNTLNPDFVKKFTLDYFFEERQHLRFQVFDIDDEHSSDLRHHDFLGEAEVTLGEIVASASCSKRLTGTSIKSGSITFIAEEQSTSKEELIVQFVGKQLDKKDWFGKSDPYLAFYKLNEDGSKTVVHRTEVIKNTLNPSWAPMNIPLRTLCSGDKDRLIHVKCFDWNRSGEEDLIGEFFFTINELLGSGGGPICNWSLIHPEKKAKKRGYKHSGIVMINGQPKCIFVPTFLDYVSAGTQLQCTIAIDFTASNGHPATPESLHHIHATVPNQYQRALRAVGEVIQDYDSDQIFPVLGFGARLPPDGVVSHNFHVNGVMSSPDCHGLDCVMRAYANCLRQIQLYGPTNFAPIINRVAAEARRHVQGAEYSILLIITDGIITDMPQTRDAIVAASTLPLSIIIIGVGKADFDAMEELDGDQVRLTDRQGRKAARDIVQFVPFRDFIDQSSAHVSQARLAQAVLAEIPDQFLSYMKSKNILPADVRRRQASTVQPPVSTPVNSSSRPMRAPLSPVHQTSIPAGNEDAPPPYPGY